MIRIKLKKKQPIKVRKRLKTRARLRKKVYGTSDRPRLSVFRSKKYIYAQLINDDIGVTLGTASSLKLNLKNNKNSAQKVGEEIARISLQQNMKKVVFDRGGYIYHGRVKTLADAARSKGLEF